MKKKQLLVFLVTALGSLCFSNTDSVPGVSEDGLSAVAAPQRSRSVSLYSGEQSRRWHGENSVQTLGVPDHPLVEKYRTRYRSPEGLKWLEAIMRRAAPYRYYIETKIHEYGLPECLLFLPVVESDYITTAVSSSGAVGLWQFMKNSISPFGIRVTEWMDERRDPWLSTDAALKKLKENYDFFGDWYLAIAAYNSGLGAVRRAVEAAGSSDYWYLADNGYLRAETVEYVPKFLAVSEVLSSGGRYGITVRDAALLPECTTIEVSKSVDLGILARETGIERSLLLQYNPALYYNITPGGIRYALRIPAEREAEVRTALDNSSVLLVNSYIYRIQSGDTLYAIAKHYDISVDMIREYNPGVQERALRIGQRIVIPVLREGASYSDAVPYSGRKDPETLDFSGVYTVLPGDTLWSISLRYTIRVETLAEKNNLSIDAILRTGSVLNVPIL
ncbi:MAG: LysM peptidoglycan-binding domain-containing protein [Spirochaetaceae bacterium]|nr:LysM peptidoglycan-binding domain-containing protein [Spirochaetaceae bacterium]